MTFDVNEARRLGGTDQQIAEYLSDSYGFDYDQAKSLGGNDEQIIDYLSNFSAKTPPASPNIGAVQGQDIGPERTIYGTVKDIGISALKSAISVPESYVGIADISTGGMAGKFAEEYLAFKPDEAKEILNKLRSPAQQAAWAKVSEVDGFVDKLKMAISNPSVIAEIIAESTAPMLAGGVMGRVVSSITKAGPLVSAAVGEGLISAGSTAESIRQEQEDKLLRVDQSLMAAASGALTGAIGIVGGRIAKRLGVDDIDTMLVEASGSADPKNIATRLVAGGISEGVFEELPQSTQEKLWENAALGLPLDSGLDDAMALGLLAGAAMGGGANVISGTRPRKEKVEKKVESISNAPTTDDAIKAAAEIVKVTPEEAAAQRAEKLEQPVPGEKLPTDVQLEEQPPVGELESILADIKEEVPSELKTEQEQLASINTYLASNELPNLSIEDAVDLGLISKEVSEAKEAVRRPETMLDDFNLSASATEDTAGMDEVTFEDFDKVNEFLSDIDRDGLTPEEARDIPELLGYQGTGKVESTKREKDRLSRINAFLSARGNPEITISQARKFELMGEPETAEEIAGRIAMTPKSELEATLESKELEAERRGIRKAELEQAFEDLTPKRFQIAFKRIREQIEEGEKGGEQIRGKEGELLGFTKSSYPDWFKYKPKKELERIGRDWNWTKKDLFSVLKNVRTGKPLTDKQAERFEELKKIATTDPEISGETAIDEKYEYMLDRGFTPTTKEILVGDINPGDSVVIKEGLGYNEYKHVGFDSNGDTILEGDNTRTVDVFELLQLEGIRRSDSPIEDGVGPYLPGIPGEIGNIKFESADISESRPAATVEQLNSRIDSILSTAGRKNLGITIIQGANELENNLESFFELSGLERTDPRLNRIKGLQDARTGRTFLVADNVSEDEVWSSVLHESVHKINNEGGWPAVFGNRSESILNAVESKIENKDSSWIEAVSKAKTAGTPEGLMLEETITYWLSDTANSKTTLWQRIMNAIRAWAVNVGITRRISDQDIKSMAEYAVTKRAKQSKSFSPEQTGVLKKQVGPKTKKEIYAETAKSVDKLDYAAYRGRKEHLTIKATREIKRLRDDAGSLTDKFLGAISTRVGSIGGDKLKGKLRRFEYDVLSKTRDRQEVINEHFKAIKKKIKGKDYLKDYDVARKHSDKGKIDEINKKYGIEKEYKAVRLMLNRISKEAKAFGITLGDVFEYWPRVLKDKKGFLDAVRDGKEWGKISTAIRNVEKELNYNKPSNEHIRLTDDQKADIAAQVLSGFRNPLGVISHAKHRVFSAIPPELEKYYMTSDGAIESYVRNMTDAIEKRKFFGHIDKTVRNHKKSLALLTEVLRIGKHRLSEEKIEDIENRIAIHKQKLAEFKTDYNFDGSIGTWVVEQINNGTISEDKEQELTDILKARFSKQIGPGLLWSTYRDLSYIDTMGSFTSAVTQLGDLPFAIYSAGPKSFMKGLGRTIARKGKLTKEDIGVENVAQEMSEPSWSSKAVNKIFTATGLTLIDRLGKETLINSTIEKYQSLAKTNKGKAKIKEEFGEIFGEEIDTLIKDLDMGLMSENVKFLAFNKLSDFQPITLSEMPEKYLTAGNGRIFYMLKTFTVKQFDIYRRESFQKMFYGKTKKERTQGAKNLMYLGGLLVMANAGADEIKDWMLGRKTDLSDRVVDNIFRLSGFNKYIVWQARTEGLGTAAAKQILPPFKFANALFRDVTREPDGGGLEMVNSVPIGGKLYYWWIGRGKTKRKSLLEIRFYKKKKKLTKVKREYDRAEDKLNFRRRNMSKLYEYKKISKQQAKLNKVKADINKVHASARLSDKMKIMRINRFKAKYEKLLEKFMSEA